MTASKIYQAEHRTIQHQFATTALADKQETLIVHEIFTEEEIAFISARDMFFLSTVNSNNEPTVSYKGGAVGFVKVQNNALVFPDYDGNGMFLSIGNMSCNPNVGLLFIDFETPRRLRVQGTATLETADDTEAFPGAQLLVRVKPTQIWINCPRYIHPYKKTAQSPYTPTAHAEPKLAQWKRLDSVYESLSPKEQQLVDKAGMITIEEYNAKVRDNKA